MLKRSIDLDPFELTIEEKIFRNGKRICAGFAALAVAIGALDLINVSAVEAAAQFIHDRRASISELPDTFIAGIQNISLRGDDRPVEVRRRRRCPRGGAPRGRR
jgi:hypothetical protein